MAKVLLLLTLLIAICGMGPISQAANPIPGGILLEYGLRPPTDLIFEGQKLLPQQAYRLFQQRHEDSNGVWDLSELEPETSDLWDPNKSHLNEGIDLKDFDSLSFTSSSLSRSSHYRFIAGKKNQQYEVYFGPKVHNFLMLGKLLEKLGYHTGESGHLKNASIEFPSEQALDDFILDVETNLARDPYRWVTKRKKKKLVFQDLVIFKYEDGLPNYAKGFIDLQLLAENRRIYNALIVPFAMMNIPESINMLTWNIGRIRSQNIIFSFENIENFRTPLDDAKWITKKILELTEQDWKEIIAAGNIPPSPSRLLLEKLKARRNNLAALFDIDNENLPVNSRLNSEDGKIVDGKITQQFFPGYGRQFRIPDPDSPLSFSEMSSFFKSKIINEGIQLLIGAFNKIKYFSTDLKSKLDVLETEFTGKLEDALRNNLPLKSIIQSYAYPTASGGVQLSREIIAGSYLGTDNLIQLVDNIGINISIGVFGGVLGVFTKTGEFAILDQQGTVGRTLSPVGLRASSSAFFRRTYSHIRPIESIQKALKYPFKNMFVPGLKNKIGNELRPVTDKNLAELEENKKSEQVQSALRELKTKLDIGESLIVTDSVGIGVQAQGSMNLYQVAKLTLSTSPQKVVISRTHIVRRSEHVFHVYKDFGNINRADISLGLEALVPVVRITLRGTKGRAKTKFFNLNLHPRSKNLASKLNGLKQVLKNNSIRLLRQTKKPFVVKHQFSEKSNKIGLFVFRYNYLNSANNIRVIAPGGEDIKMFRRYSGHSKGIDYESYAEDLVGLLFAKVLKNETSLLTLSSTNPGNTFMGQASNRIITVEGFVKEKQLHTPYVKISRFWNGWRMKRKKALRLLKNIKQRYGFYYFPGHVLAQTKKFFLYNFNVSIYFFEKGIHHMLAMPDETLEKVFKHYHNKDQSSLSDQDILRRTGYYLFQRYKKRYRKWNERKKYQKASKYLSKMFSVAEKNLTVYGMRELAGGIKNFYTEAKIDGFRIGDEIGEIPIRSNSFGEIGEKGLRGPTGQIIQMIKLKERQEEGDSESMLQGEFYINWIKERLI